MSDSRLDNLVAEYLRINGSHDAALRASCSKILGLEKDLMVSEAKLKRIGDYLDRNRPRQDAMRKYSHALERVACHAFDLRRYLASGLQNCARQEQTLMFRALSDAISVGDGLLGSDLRRKIRDEGDA